MLPLVIFLLVGIIYPLSKYKFFLFNISNVGIGYHSTQQLVDLSQELAKLVKVVPLWHFALYYKKKLNAMRKNEYDVFKMYGVIGTKRDVKKASRGYDKLKDILIATRLKLSGTALSLCCGRGGWEQVIAPMHKINKIFSYTLGAGGAHFGHESFTEKPFEGKHKVHLQYLDVRTLPTIPADVILFDGGESHPDAEVEAARFLKLLRGAVDHQLVGPEQDFIFKILNPCHPDIIAYLKELQVRTGKGSLYRCSHSRNSTLEMYFVSTKAGNIENNIRDSLAHSFTRASNARAEKAREYMEGGMKRPVIFGDILQPLDMSESIKQLGRPLNESGRSYAQWESINVYPYGYRGGKGNVIPELCYAATSGLSSNMPGLDYWKLTDTTPEGFMKTFLQKIDIAPVENTPYDDEIKLIYEAMAEHYHKKGIRGRELSWEEVEKQLNKQGAAHFIDTSYENIQDFLNDPTWQQQVEACRTALDAGKPINGVFATMGKREKKETPGAPKGSRMVAFLPIAMRVLELKVFGMMDQLSKPKNDPFGVGGVGLHDLGEVLRRRFIPNGCAESTDIAGFDTRIGVKMMSNEYNHFLSKLGFGHTAKQFYRLYCYPHILVPMAATGLVRSELLKGWGQRMSGSRPTYDMNTKTREMIFLLRLVKAMGTQKEKIKATVVDILNDPNKYGISAMTSGDDHSSFFTRGFQEAFSATKNIFHEIGFPRKNLPANINAPITTNISEVEFCSHRYERVTYFQASTERTVDRYMPTRMAAEIVGKARTWLGGSSEGMPAMAWISAQAVNLLVHYHHLRTCRALGLFYKAVVPPNLMPSARGYDIHRRPWMRPGPILDVVNDLLFGESTLYPVPGFRVEYFNHLGYLPPHIEQHYDPGFTDMRRQRWRYGLHSLARSLIERYNTGGEIEVLDLWRASDMIQV